MFQAIIIISVFLASGIISGLLIPQILNMSMRRKLFDVPDDRRHHHRGAVPRLGGLVFMPATVLAVSLVTGAMMLLSDSYGDMSAAGMQVEELLVALDSSSLVMSISLSFSALMSLYLLGITDDLVGVKYPAKFAVQILAGLMLAAAGARIDSLDGMFGIYLLSPAASWLLTVFIVVFITNAINLIDGIDGLASGIGGAALIFYGMYFLTAGHWFYAMIAFASLGNLIPFFYYNVFGNPAKGTKIFMGDTGSLTTGLVLSVLAIRLASLDNAEIFTADRLVVAFAPLAIPCLDVIRVFFHRIIRGHSPFLPDRVHIHHKLLALGFSQRPAMTTILAASIGLLGLNLMLSPAVTPLAIVALDLTLWVVLNFLLTRAIKSYQTRHGITDGYS